MQTNALYLLLFLIQVADGRSPQDFLLLLFGPQFPSRTVSGIPARNPTPATVQPVGAAQENGFGPMKDVRAFSGRFDQATKGLTSTRSDFVQEKHLSFMEDNLVSKGIFRYKKQDKVRLEYITPFPYLMVLNGGKLYIRDGNKVNKFDTRSNRLFRQINDLMINTLNGNILRSKDYVVSYYENGSTYLVELKPTEKSVQDLMQKIQVYIDKNKLSVSKIGITEKSGDYTMMSFSNTEQNTAIQDEEFVVR